MYFQSRMSQVRFQCLGRLCVLDWGQVRQLSQPERLLPEMHQFSLAALPFASKSLEIITAFHLFLHHDQVIAKGRNINCHLFDIL